MKFYLTSDNPELKLKVSELSRKLNIEIFKRPPQLQIKDFSEDSLRMIVKKNIKGKDSTFIELPGLWNGSMHYWHTTFVEIPGASFTPVKNFTDLFLSIHQP